MQNCVALSLLSRFVIIRVSMHTFHVRTQVHALYRSNVWSYHLTIVESFLISC